MPRHSGERPYGFRGVVIVYAESMDDAIQKSWHLNSNSGGEVLAGLMDHTPQEKWVNRLLSRELVAVNVPTWAEFDEKAYAKAIAASRPKKNGASSSRKCRSPRYGQIEARTESKCS
jgi:hypothetical protein